MIPIDCKITNFYLYLFLCFFREIMKAHEVREDGGVMKEI